MHTLVLIISKYSFTTSFHIIQPRHVGRVGLCLNEKRDLITWLVVFTSSTNIRRGWKVKWHMKAQPKDQPPTFSHCKGSWALSHLRPRRLDITRALCTLICTDRPLKSYNCYDAWATKVENTYIRLYVA